MYSHASSGPMVEQLEGRQLFSAGIESVHGFIAPDGSPYLYGKYTMTLHSGFESVTGAPDPTPFAESHVVTVKRHDGPSFSGWIWGGKRTKMRGSWNSAKDQWQFSLEFTSSTGRITRKANMSMVWDGQEYVGTWFYHSHGQHYMAGMTMQKPQPA
jgi:hypothetical protein